MIVLFAGCATGPSPAHGPEVAAEAARAHAAVVRGDEAAARAALDALAPLLPGAPGLEKVVLAATTAPDGASVAAAVARLANACGECHLAAGHRPALPPDPGPAASWPERHRQAAERLWDGAIAADPARWSAGALEVLAPMNPGGFGRPELAALAAEVQALGAPGLAALPAPERVVLHAELLSACGTCHAR